MTKFDPKIQQFLKENPVFRQALLELDASIAEENRAFDALEEKTEKMKKIRAEIENSSNWETLQRLIKCNGKADLTAYLPKLLEG